MVRGRTRGRILIIAIRQSHEIAGTRLVALRDGWFGGSRLVIVLAIVAVALVASAIVVADVLPLTGARLGRPSAALIGEFGPWAALRGSGVPVPNGDALGAVVIGATIVPFAAYAIAVLAVWGRALTSRGLVAIAGCALVLWVVFAFALPTYDTDIFNYIASGRVGAVHGANPHLVAPIAFPEDPLLGFASPRYTHVAGDNKLPAWTLVNVVLAGVAGDKPLANLFLYRGFFLALNVVNLGLIAVVVRRLAPRLVATALLLYGWHPIVAAVGQSKVDTFMVTLLLLAAVAITAGRTRLAVVGLAASSVVKLTSVPLLAVTIVHEAWRRRWREVAILSGIALIVALATYLPFGDPRAVLPAHVALLGSGGSSFPTSLRPFLAAGFVTLIVWSAARQDESPQAALRSWALVALYFGAFLTRIAYAWYLMPLIVLVALVPSWALVAAMIAITFASASFDAWFSFPLPSLLAIPTELAYTVPVVAVAAGITALVWVERGARGPSGNGRPQGDEREGSDQHP
jgi:hypothetical protein